MLLAQPDTKSILNDDQLLDEHLPQQQSKQDYPTAFHHTDKYSSKKKCSLKKKFLISVASISLIITVILTTFLPNDQRKIGNPQANLLNALNYCCQASNSEIYICYPSSQTIWQYRDGDLFEAYKSRYAVLSLYDTGTDLVLESIYNGFSIINKRTGEEKELIKLSRYMGLNTYKDVLYYVTPSVDSLTESSYYNLETYALNLKNGSKTQLANGGNYVSNEGVYFLTPNSNSYDVSFVEHSNIQKPVYKVVDNVKTNDQNDMLIILRVDNDWIYYAIYNNNSGYRVIRKSGDLIEDLFTSGDVQILNSTEAIYRIRGFSEFNRYFFNKQDHIDKLELEKTEKSFNSEASDIRSFYEPKKQNEMIYVTINYYRGGFLCLWDKDGTFLKEISIQDTTLG